MDIKKSSKLINYIKSFNFYNLVSFYVIWYLCILGASFHFERTAVVISFLLVLIHYTFSQKRLYDFIYLIVIAKIGFFTDWVFLRFDILSYPVDTLAWNFYGVPLWILMLYVGFSTTMNHSLLFVNHYPILSAIGGGIGGAVCYFFAYLRGIIFFPNPILSLLIIGSYWGLLIGLAKPFQAFISKRFN